MQEGRLVSRARGRLVRHSRGQAGEACKRAGWWGMLVRHARGHAGEACNGPEDVG